MTRANVCLLGATGSIGKSSLEVIRHNQERFYLYSVGAHANHEQMLKIMLEFAPKRVALANSQSAQKLRDLVNTLCSSSSISEFTCSDGSIVRLPPNYHNIISKIEILEGSSGINAIAQDTANNIVIGAIVGAAGLMPLMHALKTGARICLANKEALVMSGQLFFDEAKKYNAQILPVDSEHSAIFQSLPQAMQANIGSCNLKSAGVREILLTGSGGPFRQTPLEELKNVSAKMAINHPVWSMGPKISVDSASMMNKALEFIEARYLFNASFDEVKVLIHPQAVVHSMVSYIDGAVIAQLGSPDMKTPIACAMAYPERIKAQVEPLDFTKMSALSFCEVDFKRYPCLKLGMQASKLGQAATTALNAANEIAVDAFLHDKISFVEIAHVVEHVLDKCAHTKAYSLEEILAVDQKAREQAQEFINLSK